MSGPGSGKDPEIFIGSKEPGEDAEDSGERAGSSDVPLSGRRKKRIKSDN